MAFSSLSKWNVVYIAMPNSTVTVRADNAIYGIEEQCELKSVVYNQIPQSKLDMTSLVLCDV